MSIDPVNHFDAHDPLDPLYLVSRQLDGDLTNEEALALEAALAASPELRAEAARMAAAQGAVDEWAAEVPDFDANELTQFLMGAVRDEAADHEFASVDAVLRRWARPVKFNERAFTTGVMRQLAAETSRRRLKLVYRVAVPLAMAAAVVFAVTSGLWTAPAAVVQVSIGPSVAMRGDADGSGPAATSVVVFSREAPAERVARAEVRMISLGATRAEPMANGDEFPPL